MAGVPTPRSKCVSGWPLLPTRTVPVPSVPLACTHTDTLSAPTRATTQVDDQGNSKLHLLAISTLPSVTRDAYAQVAECVADGCSPNHTNLNGDTPLHCAARSGNVEASRMCIAVAPRSARIQSHPNLVFVAPLAASIRTHTSPNIRRCVRHYSTAARIL